MTRTTRMMLIASAAAAMTAAPAQAQLGALTATTPHDSVAPAAAAIAASTPAAAGPALEQARAGLTVQHSQANVSSIAVATTGDQHQGTVLMIVGGAAMIGGAVVGDRAGGLIGLGGLIVGLYGLYLYVK